MEDDATKPIRTAFATTLRQQRNLAGFSQEELAFRAGLTPRYISLLECDQRQPTISTLYQLADALGMSFGEFCVLIGDSLPTERKAVS